MNKTITIEEALRRIKDGSFAEDCKVSFEGVEKIESLDAASLGANSIDVPEALIYYDDSTIEDDAEFEGDWVRIDSDIEEEKKYLKLEMKISPEISSWLSSSKVDLSVLVERLLENAYEMSKILQK